MIIYAKPNYREPIGEVLGTDADGYFAIPAGTIERVGPYTTPEGAYGFLVREAGATAEFYIDGGQRLQLQ